MQELYTPKFTVFFFSFSPQYVSGTNGKYIIQSAILGIAFMVMTFIVFVIYGLLAGIAREWFSRSEKRMSVLQKIFGFTFIGFAVRLEVEQ